MTTTAALPATKTNGVDHRPPTLTCAEPGCEAKLAPTNRSGKCRDHRDHKKLSGNGAVAVSERKNSNGASHHPLPARAANGANTTPQLDRVNLLLAADDGLNLVLAAMPTEDKRRLAAAWLTGH